MHGEPIETWRVDSYPPLRTYESLHEAIAAPEHPLGPRAARDTMELAGLVLTAASWSDTEAWLAFTERRCLHVAVADHFVDWRVEHVIAAAWEPGVFAADVDLDWGNIGVHRWHRRALLQQRIGSTCQQLCLNDFGLLLYCDRQPILCFSAIRDVGNDRDVLHFGDFD